MQVDEYTSKVLKALRDEAKGGFDGYDDERRFFLRLEGVEFDPDRYWESLSPNDKLNVLRLARYAVQRLRLT